MTIPLSRARRRAVWLWVILAVVVWNGVYDLLVSRGVKDYLMRCAMHDAGQGPDVQLVVMMDFVVRDAAWVATIWALIILLAGLWTIRSLARAGSA